MNTTELREKLRARDNEHDDISEIVWDADDKLMSEILGVPTTFEVCGERHNSEVVWVMKVGEDYFRLIGGYSSWDGPFVDSWTGDWEKVEPQQKTITVYKRVKG